MPTSALILSAAILAGVFLSDLGVRAVTRKRLIRPLVIAGIAGASYLTAFATSGSGLAIEIAGVSAGAALGLLAATLMHVEHDERQGHAVTRTGYGYAAIWWSSSAPAWPSSTEARTGSPAASTAGCSLTTSRPAR